MTNYFASVSLQLLSKVFWDVMPCRLLNSYRRFGGS